MTLYDFRKKYPARLPGKQCQPAELIELKDADGVFELSSVPKSAGLKTGVPPTCEQDLKSPTRYLWVISATQVPSVLEAVNCTAKGVTVAKHSNLTAGAAAHCGGEAWFESQSRLYISGASGRYGPQDAQQHSDVIAVFRSIGYTVADLGWDTGTNRPLRILRGKPQWK